MTQYAFPTEYDGAHHGMTLRDYIAAQAFGACMGNVTGLGGVSQEERHDALLQMANIIYEAADVMIEARK